MKRVLLIGFILAICILAFPQGVAAEVSTGSATVTASIADYIALTPVSPDLWSMSYGVNTCGPHCNRNVNAISGVVNSNDDWTLTSQAHVDGLMKAGATPLINKLGIETISGPVVDLTAVRTLAGGTGGSADQSFARDLEQVLDIRDRSDLGNYEIIITLDATSST